MSIKNLYLFLKKNKYQITKFIITGLISSFLNFLVYVILYQLGTNINLASFSGYLVGLINSFLFSKIWIFNKSQTNRFNRDFVLFTCIYILGGLEMIIIINFGIYFLGNYKVAWLFGALLAATNNYLGSKFLLFKS
tara:strand:+ start:2713 stop:3120 length:408 start_codon:yes stop_codon:yes gene_type:complete